MEVTRRQFLVGSAITGAGLLFSDWAAPALASTTTSSSSTMAAGVDITVNTSPGMTLQDVYLAHRSTYQGPLGGHTKFFSSSGIDLAYKKMTDTWSGITDESLPVLCFKTWDPAAFNAVMDNMTSDWFAVYYQEPEDDGAAGVAAAQPAVYCQVYAAMDLARAAHPNGGHVSLLKDLSRYCETNKQASGYTWRDYDGGQQLSRLYIGGDAYSAKWQRRPLTAGEMFGWLVDWHNATGLPFGVPEYGVARTLRGTTFTDSQRASTIQSHLDYLTSNGCSWVNYWCDGDTGNGDWRLEGTAALNTWLAAMGR